MSKNHEKIKKKFDFLHNYYPNNIVTLMLYSKYLHDIINNSFEAVQVFTTAFEKVNAYKL